MTKGASRSDPEPERIIEVGGTCGHAVRIRAGLLADTAARLSALGIPPSARILVVADRNTLEPHHARLHRGLAAAGYATATVALDADEVQKAMPAVEAIWSAALAHGLRRRDAIVALGGGLVGDVAGFAAATYLRGVAILQCPTTLLAMVDASTGGKTGINLRLPDGSLGKNLAGAFWPPREVLIDPETLTTLPLRERSSGLAECVKHAILDGEEHLELLERHVDAALALDDARQLAELIERSVRVKARIVERDPLERGERALLNLGHTVAHAIETEPALGLTHGEAVALGLVAISRAAVAAGRAEDSFAARVVALLGRCGLPTEIAAAVGSGLPPESILHRMGFDKKQWGKSLRFVVPEAPGCVRYDQELPEAAVRAGLAAIGIV
jgi:3-dehydroquinate synthase